MLIRSQLNDSGVTLLEVLISMIILTIGILGLAPMVVLSVEGNVISREHSIASQLLKEKIEECQTRNPMPTTPYRENESDLQGLYSRMTTIQDHDSDSLIPEGVYNIDVVVSWIDHQDVQRSTTYSSMILKN